MPSPRPIDARAVVVAVLLSVLAACGPSSSAGRGGGGGGGGGSAVAAASPGTPGGDGGGGGAAPVAVPPGATLALVTGADQTVVRGSSLAPFVVRVADAQGTPLAGVTVAWAVTEGNGSISPAVSRTRPDGTTWALATAGLATARNRFTAAAAGVEGSPLALTGTGTAGAPDRIVAVRGEGQSAVVGSALTAPLVIQVRDVNGVPVPSVQVVWAAASGGGALVSQRPTTDADGLASATVRLSRVAGRNVFTAAGLGFSGGAVSFPSTGVPGEAWRVTRLAPLGSSFTAGSNHGLTVKVTDRYGNPVQGATVRWGRTSGTGSVAPSTSETGAGGVASASATLGAEPGMNGFSASLPHAKRAAATFSFHGT